MLNLRTQFQAGGMCLLRGAGVSETVGQRWAGCVAVKGHIQRIGDAVLARAAEVIDQQVARQGGNPGLEAALVRVEAGKVAVELEEDLLRQVLGVCRRSRKPVADGID